MGGNQQQDHDFFKNQSDSSASRQMDPFNELGQDSTVNNADNAYISKSEPARVETDKDPVGIQRHDNVTSGASQDQNQFISYMDPFGDNFN
jgi:hypothetical protein